MQSYSKKRERNEAGRKFARGVAVVNIQRRPGRRAQGLINVEGTVFACALGRGGVAAFKREGDGATPRAAMRILGGFFRADRLRSRPIVTPLAMRRTPASLGWCDAPGDGNYNRPVRLPYPGSHERMMREDHLYDVCIVLDWNVSERRRGCGSAIFLHLARPGCEPTEGCVAVPPRTMARLLAHLSRRTVLRVLG